MGSANTTLKRGVLQHSAVPSPRFSVGTNDGPSSSAFLDYPMQRFAMRGTRREFGTVLKVHHVFPVEPRLQLLDPVHVDDRRAMHAHEAVRGEAWLEALEPRLAPHGFVRVHRSAIVNVDRIKELEPWFHGEYVVHLKDGTKLTSSAAHSEALHRIVEKG